LGVALAGDGLFDKVKVWFTASGDEKGFREQVSRFLAGKGISFAGSPEEFRKACLADLNKAIKAKRLSLTADQFASAETLGERIALFQREAAAHGRRYEPTQVVVARDMFVVDNERQREAAIDRNNEVHARTLSVSRAPDRAGGSHILAYAHTAQQQRESPLIGTPDEIVAKLQTLRAAGVEYVMLNAAGSGANLRRFAREVMPHVAAQPCRVPAAR
jgi:hypothetical protein